MQRVVQVIDLVIHAINGQGVLDQVVGADGEELAFPRQPRGREGGARHLDHGADLGGIAEFALLLRELGLDVVNQLRALPQFENVGDHWNHDPGPARAGGAQQCPQLGAEQAAVFEAQAHRAQAQGRIRGLRDPHGLRLLVRAQVQRADGHRAVHRGDYLPVGQILLFFTRWLLAVHEQELGAVKANAFGTHFLRLGHIARQLDVGHQADRLTVARAGRLVLEAQQHAPVAGITLASTGVEIQGDPGRCGDQMARMAVDDEHFAVFEQAACAVESDDGGDAQAASENRGVRQGTARFGHKAGNTLAVEQDDVGWRDIIGHHNRRALVRGLAGAQGLVILQQDSLNLRYDMLDIVTTAAQIRIFHRLEYADERVTLAFQGRFGIDAALGDQLFHGLGEGAVFEHQHVGLDERGNLARRPLGNAFLDVLELAARAT